MLKVARIALLLLTLPASPALACSCGPPPPMCQRLHEIKVMFVGTPVETNDEDGGYIESGLWYRFEVHEVFKGLDTATKEVIVDPASGTSCQRSFKMGKRYLITSYGDTIADQHSAAISIIPGPNKPGKPRPPGPVVVVGGCSGSKPLEYALEDIAFLRQYHTKPGPAKILGFIRAGDAFSRWRDEHPPIEGVQVQISDAATTVSAMSDAQGNFTVSDVPPGSYEVHAVKPGYRMHRSTYQVQVPEHGCGVAQIALTTNARISGRVLSHDGTPASAVPVQVVFADSKYNESYFHLNSAKTDKDGRFRIGGLPAGDFLVGAYIASGPSMSARIPATYWPGTTDVDAANTLRLEPDQFQEDMVIRLAAPVKTRKVTVHVRWPDGRPAKAAYVSISPDGLGELKNVADGTLTVLEEVEYEFQSRVWTSFRTFDGREFGDKFVDGKVNLPAGTGPAEITIIMNQPCCQDQ